MNEIIVNDNKLKIKANFVGNLSFRYIEAKFLLFTQIGVTVSPDSTTSFDWKLTNNNETVTKQEGTGFIYFLSGSPPTIRLDLQTYIEASAGDRLIGTYTGFPGTDFNGLANAPIDPNLYKISLSSYANFPPDLGLTDGKTVLSLEISVKSTSAKACPLLLESLNITHATSYNSGSARFSINSGSPDYQILLRGPVNQTSLKNSPGVYFAENLLPGLYRLEVKDRLNASVEEYFEICKKK